MSALCESGTPIFNLFREGILAIGDTLQTPDGPITGHSSLLRFIAGSGGTMKLILDAGLAG